MVAAAAASVLTNLQLPPAMIRNGHDKVVPVPAAADAGVAAAAAAAAARTAKGGGLEKEGSALSNWITRQQKWWQ